MAPLKHLFRPFNDEVLEMIPSGRNIVKNGFIPMSRLLLLPMSSGTATQPSRLTINLEPKGGISLIDWADVYSVTPGFIVALQHMQGCLLGFEIQTLFLEELDFSFLRSFTLFSL